MRQSKEALKRYAQSPCQGLIIDNSSEETGICHGCELGKSHCLPFPLSNKCASQLLELVHSDLVGPLQSNSIQGNKYFATFIDDYTRVAVIVPLKSKDQLSGALVHYWQWAERQMEHYKLKCFHSDRGGENVNKQVKTSYWKQELSINSPCHTLHNKMVELNVLIEPLWKKALACYMVQALVLVSGSKLL